VILLHEKKVEMATEIDIFQIGAKLTGHWSLVTGQPFNPQTFAIPKSKKANKPSF
jgi:hypothetical protein